MRMFRDFYEAEKFVRNLNTTFFVDESEKRWSEDFKDFKPISLIGSLYKLLVKVLTNRLKRVLPSLINKPQNAFVETQQILDLFVLSNEVIDALLKKRERGVMCKLDIEKVFDHLNLNFLFGVLQKTAFRWKWMY